MRITPTTLPDVLCIEPTVFSDARGSLYESFNARGFEESTGIHTHFVQDNHSTSAQHVLRGLHYQIQRPQGKLVRVTAGAVLDVVVDIRKSSPHFGKWCATVLSAKNHLQLWIPPGYAHGFLALSDTAEFLYKATDYWMPQYERCILWNDPAIGIDWTIPGIPLLSDKDKAGKTLANAEVFD